jgi:Nif-specific regulatory protein
MIDEEDLLLSKLSTAGDTVEGRPLDQAFRPCSLEEIERVHIQATLNYANWNKSRAATMLGIERSTLDRKIRRYNLVEDGPGGPRPDSNGDRQA